MKPNYKEKSTGLKVYVDEDTGEVWGIEWLGKEYNPIYKFFQNFDQLKEKWTFEPLEKLE